MERKLSRFTRLSASLTVAAGLFATAIFDARAQTDPCTQWSVVGEWTSFVGPVTSKLVITSQSPVGELAGMYTELGASGLPITGAVDGSEISIQVSNRDGQKYAWISLEVATPERFPWMAPAEAPPGPNLAGIVGKYGTGEHGRVAFSGGPAQELSATCDTRSS